MWEFGERGVLGCYMRESVKRGALQSTCGVLWCGDWNSTITEPIRFRSQTELKKSEPADKQQRAARSKGGAARTCTVTPSCFKYRQAPLPDFSSPFQPDTVC